MVRKQIVTEDIICDVCYGKIAPGINSAIRFGSSTVDDPQWDVCPLCKDKLQTVLTFLSITVGIDIVYKWVKP